MPSDEYENEGKTKGKIQVSDQNQDLNQDQDQEQRIFVKLSELKDFVNKYDKVIRDFDKQTRLFEQHLKFPEKTESHQLHRP